MCLRFWNLSNVYISALWCTVEQTLLWSTFKENPLIFISRRMMFKPSAKHTIQQNMKFNIWPFPDDFFSCSHCISGQHMTPHVSGVFPFLWQLVMWGFSPNYIQTEESAWNKFLVCAIARAHWVVSLDFSRLTKMDREPPESLRQDAGIFVAGSIWDQESLFHYTPW